MKLKKIMKLITALVLTAAILLPGSTFASVDIMQDSSQQFKDINQYSWAKDAINYFGRAGIINGDGKGNYMPGKNVTREEFASMLANSFNTDTAVSGQTFSDVPSTRWSYKAIESTREYLTGYYPPNGGKPFFDPGGKATREDVAVALAKILGFTGEDLENPDVLEENFTDANQVSLNLRDIVGVVVEQKIMVGSGKYLRPTAPITRAEVAVLLYKVLKGTVADAKEPLKLTVDVPEVTNDPEITISGITQPGARVKVNGYDVQVDSYGQFEVDTTLESEGKYDVEVVAIKNGRKAVVKKTVDYKMNSAVINLPNFSETSTTQYVTIEGTLTGVDYSSDFTINGEDVLFASEYYGSDTYEFSYYAELKDGANPFVFSVKNKNGKVTTVTKVITFSQAAPELTITNCPETSAVSSVTISGTVKDSADMYPEVYINNEKIYTTWANKWSKTVTLKEGKNVFVIKAVNSSGKSTEITKEIVYTSNDSTAPVLTITSCPATSSESTVTISGTVEDSTDLYPEVTINNEVVYTTWSNTWSKTVTLTEGTNTFVIKATNSKGKSTQITKAIVYTAASAPESAPVLILTNCPATTAESTVTISGRVSDNIDKWPNDSPNVYINNESVSVTWWDNYSWSKTVTLSAGTNTFIIRATNSKGKSTEITKEIVYSQDAASPPVLTITSCPSTSSESTVTISGTVSDSIDKWPNPLPSIYINNESVSVSVFSNSWSKTVTLSEGTNTFVIRATNSKGKSTEITREIYYTPSQPATDQLVPTVNVSLPYSVTTSTLTVSGTVSDSVDTYPPLLAVTVNGQAVSVDASGYFSTTITLSAGENEVAVKAVNSRGNSREIKQNVTYSLW